jgi:serine/threonine protein kinase
MIGTGKFSIVYRCTSKESGRSFALKDISTEKLTSQAIATLDNESEIMKIISHPQIVKYQETIRSKAHIYIIAEYIYGNDLYEYVKRRKRLSEYISAFIIGKVIEATLYLHSLEIIHRDLKPENIMVMLRPKSQLLSTSSLATTERVIDDEPIENIKIIDFGLANHLSELEKSSERHGIAGTPNYIAPEVILGELPTFKADTFAIGSILYFL